MGNIIDFSGLKDKQFIEEFPDSFNLDDAQKFSLMIENALNDFYSLSLEDEKYHSVCTDEQFIILSMVYQSFFKILYSELDDFDTSEKSNAIMYKFLSELYKICKKLPDIDIIRKNIDNNTLEYKKED